VGRVVRPIKDHAANLAFILDDPAMKNVYFDISWDEVAKYVVSSPETTKAAADLINRFPDRFLFGTDEVAPTSQQSYLKVFYQYQPLWNLLSPEASEKIRKGNFARLFDQSHPKVRAWEAAHKTASQADSQPGAHLQ
jgi:predicted TIM-barrel fold metal-dependent hydrolase